MVSIKRILFIVFILLGIIATAQQKEFGLPYIENIPASKIGYSGDLYDIAQDAENVMYFSHEKGVIAFDGASWNLISTHGRPALYKTQNGQILVGEVNMLGRIVSDVYNRKTIEPIKIDSTKQWGRITNIVEYQNEIFFVANGIVYDLVNGQVEKNTLSSVSQLYVDRSGVVASCENGTWICTDVKKGFVQKTSVVVDGIVRTNDKLLIHTSQGFKNADSIDADWKTDDSYSSNFRQYTDLAVLVDNTLCVGTRQGVFCFAANGANTLLLDSQVGLLDDEINNLYVDKQNNLWATHSAGVSRIEMNTSISYFNENNGLEGSVRAIVRNAGNLYVATNKGVYKLLDGTHFINCFRVACNALVSYKNQAIAATSSGLYNLSTSEQICTDAMENVFVFNDKLVTIQKSQLSVWEHQGASIHLTARQKLPNIEVTTLASMPSQSGVSAMLGTLSDGVWTMAFDSVLKIEKCQWPGFPKNVRQAEVYETTLGVVFALDDGLYRCDAENGFFYKDAKIQIPATMENLRMLPVVEDKDKNLWFAFHKEGIYENQVAVAWNTNNFERYTLILAPFSKVRNFHTEHILTEENSVAWLGGPDGLVRMDFNNISVKKHLANVKFTKITLDEDSLLTQCGEQIVLPHDMKSIAFDFVSVEFENHDDIFYSWYLEGEESLWSVPSTIHSKEYTNLPAGKYIFHVIAKRASGASSEETVFSFVVKQHPLLTIWAFIVYALILGALIWWLSNLRARKLAKEHAIVNQMIENKTKQLQQNENKPSEESSTSAEETVVDWERGSSMNFELATVLFSDFKGFTKLTEKLSADSLIRELDKYFTEFDKIIEQYNVEKIKTVGDSYMCAGGLPKKNTTNPIEVVAAALEMQYRINEMQKDYPENTEAWGVRIGVHTGPVIAGVVGGKKLSYDIWGDSVNIADRMEAAGEVGKVNVSENTYLMVREFFDCEYRGKISVKGKDEKMDMYFVTGFKPMFAKEGVNVLPNNNFTSKLTLLRFDGLQEQVFSLYEEKIPKMYYYHNVKHVIDVVTQVEVIGTAEGVSDADMFILKTAALLHDAGYMRSAQNHEQNSANIAKEILTKEGYSSAQIVKVCQLIESTNLKEQPKDLLEKILRDANFDYLGREDYLCVSRELYKEYLELKMTKKNEYEWYKMQLQFMQDHTYYTDYSRSQRNSTKVNNIKWLQEQILKFNIK